MFFSKTSGADLDTNGSAAASQQAAVARLRTAAAAAQVAAQNAAMAAANAAQSANTASQTAVRQARLWAAPQLEHAADYCTTVVAPKVSAALRSTAEQVRPVEVTTRRRMPRALTWSLLSAAVLAGLGAAAALVRYRYRTAMATDSEDDTLRGEPGMSGTSGMDTAADSDDSMSRAPGEPSKASGDTTVNGRVSATGW